MSSQNSAQVSPPPAESPWVWLEERVEAHGRQFALGHRKPTDDDSIEPVIAVSREGKVVPDAMVFCSVVNSSGVVGEEAAAIFIPAAAGTTAVYSAGKQSRPSGKMTFRFRIVLPDVDEDFVREVRCD